jgi:hypothetical protein
MKTMRLATKLTIGCAPTPKYFSGTRPAKQWIDSNQRFQTWHQIVFKQFEKYVPV